MEQIINASELSGKRIAQTIFSDSRCCIKFDDNSFCILDIEDVTEGFGHTKNAIVVSEWELEEDEEKIFLADSVISNQTQKIDTKNMKITKPIEMTSGTTKVQDAIREFEKSFSRAEKDRNYYHLIIEGEYNRETCDEVEKNYREAGWIDVTCSTSSEKGERGGLTGLKLCRS